MSGGETASALRTDLRHAARIARVELRRSARSARSETNVLVGLLFSAVVGLGVAVAVAAGLVLFGDALREVGATARSFVRTGAVSAWLLGALLVGFRVVGQTGAVDGEAGILTAVSARATALGLLLAEAGRVGANLAAPVAVVLLGVAVGVGPVVALAALATLLAVAAVAVPLGYLGGMTALYLSRTVGVVRRNRLTLAAAFFVAYMGMVLAFGRFTSVLAATPLGWFGDPVLVALGVGGSPARAAAALATPIVATPIALAGSVRVAAATWYADPATDEGGDAATALARVDDVLAPLVSRPTASVARKTVLRARRAPYTLTFALVPAFAFVGYVSQVVRTGHVGGALPVMAAAYAGWGVGSAFTLNPFGDEGALLPVTLSAGVSGAQFVGGRVVAAWLLGVPVVLVVAALAAVAAMPAWQAVGAVAFAAVFSLGAPPVAAGIGASFPKFDTRKMLGNREAVVPSLFAFVGFGLALLPLGAPGVLGLLLAGLVAEEFGAAAVAVALAGVAVTALLCAAVGGLSYRWAAHRFDAYEVS